MDAIWDVQLQVPRPSGTAFVLRGNVAVCSAKFFVAQKTTSAASWVDPKPESSESCHGPHSRITQETFAPVGIVEGGGVRVMYGI